MPHPMAPPREPLAQTRAQAIPDPRPTQRQPPATVAAAAMALREAMQPSDLAAAAAVGIEAHRFEGGDLAGFARGLLC